MNQDVQTVSKLGYLHHLEGIRGLAAFYVMQYHAMSYISLDDRADGILAGLVKLLKQGHFAVLSCPATAS